MTAPSEKFQSPVRCQHGVWKADLCYQCQDQLQTAGFEQAMTNTLEVHRQTFEKLAQVDQAGLDENGLCGFVLDFILKHEDMPSYRDVAEWQFENDPRIVSLRAEVDSYKKAKSENDERFMLERDEARAERDQLRVQIETTKLLLEGERNSCRMLDNMAKALKKANQQFSEHLKRIVDEQDARIERLESALKEAREQLALMAEGEGSDHKVYMRISRHAMNEIDDALKKEG